MGLRAQQVNTETKAIPTGFMELQRKLFMLRPIHSKADYNKALETASGLASRTHLTLEQADYLKVLTSNIKAYEEERRAHQ